MGASGHFVKPQGKKPYLKKREWIVLLSILGAIALGVAAYFIVAALRDDSLPIRRGKVVTDVENPIIVNEGTNDHPKCYVYGSYDFSSLDADISVEDVNGDGYATGIYVYPSDESYSYGYIYGIKFEATERAQYMHDNIGQWLKNGDVHDVESYTRDGRTGSIYWYTDWEYNDETSEREYSQTFSLYMPVERGCMIVRVVHKGADESAYVDAATGYEEVGQIVDCLNLSVSKDSGTNP